MLCYSKGLDKQGMEAYAELLSHTQLAVGVDGPLHFKIQKFHRNKIADFVAAAGDEEKYKLNLRKKVVGRIIVPSKRLLHTLDPKRTRKYNRLFDGTRQYQRKYHAFLRQHEPMQKAIIDKWHLSEYLEVMGNFTLLTIIKSDTSEKWGI
jgi:hypothetical protein